MEGGIMGGGAVDPPRTTPGRVIITAGGAVVPMPPPASVVSTPVRRSSGRVGTTAIVPPASTQPTSASSSGPWRRARRSDGISTTVAAAYPAACSGSKTSPVVGSVGGEPTVRPMVAPDAAYGDEGGRHAGAVGQLRMTTERRDGSFTSTSSGAIAVLDRDRRLGELRAVVAHRLDREGRRRARAAAHGDADHRLGVRLHVERRARDEARLRRAVVVAAVGALDLQGPLARGARRRRRPAPRARANPRRRRRRSRRRAPRRSRPSPATQGARTRSRGRAGSRSRPLRRDPRRTGRRPRVPPAPSCRPPRTFGLDVGRPRGHCAEQRVDHRVRRHPVGLALERADQAMPQRGLRDALQMSSNDTCARPSHSATALAASTSDCAPRTPAP